MASMQQNLLDFRRRGQPESLELRSIRIPGFGESRLVLLPFELARPLRSLQPHASMRGFHSRTLQEHYVWKVLLMLRMVTELDP
jgi:hypothetical protein